MRPITHPVLHSQVDQIAAPDQPGELIYVAMGCFWGAERIFWRLNGVINTAVGYMGGSTADPTYRQVCSLSTGHAETVAIRFDPAVISDEQILATFWENHDPTQVDRQGNDIGTQYRLAIFPTTETQAQLAQQTKDAFQAVLAAQGAGQIATEIIPASEAGPFYFAEGYHQQYLHHNPGGYCMHGQNGFTCPIGIAKLD